MPDDPGPGARKRELSSRLAGFYRLDPDARLAAVARAADLSEATVQAWREGLAVDDADHMVENVIGTFALPNAVAVNFRINGRDRLVPMVVEEPSVLAAVSYMAKVSRTLGGFVAEADPSVMIGQIQLMDVRDADACEARLREALPHLEHVARQQHPRLVERGGGFRGFEIRRVVYDEPGEPREVMVVLHVRLDCRDAMGANMINTVCEQLAPLVEEATGETVGLRILSNLASNRLARAKVRIHPDDLAQPDMDGQLVAERICAAWRFAWADPYRATTHNKGVMNGIDAVALATGNDWRALEAGAHAWCARDGQYRPMTRWRMRDGMLEGSIEIPVQFGTVGGPIRLHPTVKANLALLGATEAGDLAEVAVAVGLAQNLAALRALACEGIQAGHMRMHAKCVAATAGARTADEVEAVVQGLVDANDYSIERARGVLATLRDASPA